MTPSPSDDPDSLAAALRWYADMGIDWTVDEHPHDRFAEAEQAGRAAPPPDEPPPRSRFAPKADPSPAPPPAAPRASILSVPPRPDAAVALSTDAAARSARETAAAAADLAALREALEIFEGCALKRTASRLVFADGAPGSRVMLIGEAPGAEEDRTGRPFVGRAGQLLDRMLAAIGLDRTQVYIANVVPWRPPGNRAPTPQETAICLPFIERQIALAAPDLLVALGGASAQALFGVKEGVLRLRGTWRSYPVGGPDSGRSVDALITLHPAYLLRTPAAKAHAWRDLRALRRALDALPPR